MQGNTLEQDSSLKFGNAYRILPRVFKSLNRFEPKCPGACSATLFVANSTNCARVYCICYKLDSVLFVLKDVALRTRFDRTQFERTRHRSVTHCARPSAVLALLSFQICLNICLALSCGIFARAVWLLNTRECLLYSRVVGLCCHAHECFTQFRPSGVDLCTQMKLAYSAVK